jgi:hypothetical protein
MSKIAVLPFPFIFSSYERAIMGIIAQAQVDNKFPHMKMQLATTSVYSLLPGVYESFTLEQYAIEFGLDLGTYDDANWILEQLLDKSDSFPRDVTPFLSLHYLEMQNPVEDLKDLIL